VPSKKTYKGGHVVTVTPHVDVESQNVNKGTEAISEVMSEYALARAQNICSSKISTAAQWGPEDLWCKACFWLPKGDEEQNGKNLHRKQPSHRPLCVQVEAVQLILHEAYDGD